MAMRKISTGAVLAIVIVGVILTITTAGLISVRRTVSSSGTLTAVNVGVYSESNCTTTVTSIDWGTVSPGDSVTRTVYVKNTGNTPITLNMTKSDWVPVGVDSWITVTWSREGAALGVGESVDAILTLSVSSGISGVTGFSVNIVITGTG